MKIFGKKLPSRKAVSPVIATLLMIAIAVAASIIVYVWSIGLLGGLMGGGGSQVKEQLILEAYKWNSTGGALTATLRNVGSASVEIAAWYVGGNAQTAGFADQTVSVGSTTSVSAFAVSGTFSAGVAYTLKVVSKTGGVFSFSIIYGSSG
jgi:flagellin-like protein